MIVARLDFSSKDRVQFRLSENIRVPEVSGCYILSNIYDDILYIGQSVNLRQRMQQHLDDPRMTARTSLGLATWFCYQRHDSDTLDSVEQQLLFSFKAVEGRLPPLNRVGP